VDVKLKHSRDQVREVVNRAPDGRDLGFSLLDAFDYIDTLEAERATRDIAVAEAVREEARAVVALEHCDNEHEACRCTDRIRALALASIIEGVKT